MFDFGKEFCVFLTHYEEDIALLFQRLRSEIEI